MTTREFLRMLMAMLVVGLAGCSKEDGAQQKIDQIKQKAKTHRSDVIKHAEEAEQVSGAMKKLADDLVRPGVSSDDAETTNEMLRELREKRKGLLALSAEKLRKAQKYELEATRLENELIELRRQRVVHEVPPEIEQAKKLMSELEKEIEDMIARLGKVSETDVEELLKKIKSKLKR